MSDKRFVIIKELAGKELYLADSGAWVRDADRAKVFMTAREAEYSASFHAAAIVLEGRQ